MPTVHIYRDQDQVPDRLIQELGPAMQDFVVEAFHTTAASDVRVRVLPQHCHNVNTLPLEIDISLKRKPEREEAFDACMDHLVVLVEAFLAGRQFAFACPVNVKLDLLRHRIIKRPTPP